MSAEQRVKYQPDVDFSIQARRHVKRERRTALFECKTFSIMGFKHPDLEEAECDSDCICRSFSPIKGRFYYDPFSKR